MTLVGKHIARVIEDDIEYDVDAKGMSGVDQRTQFLVRYFWTRGEAWLDVQKILNAVAVIGALKILAVFENRGEPDGSDSQFFEVRKLFSHPVECASLELSIDAIVGQLVRRSSGIVKTVEHEEINPLISPVLGRRKWWGDFDSLTIQGYAPGSSLSCALQRTLHVWMPYTCWHVFFSLSFYLYELACTVWNYSIGNLVK